MKRPLFSSLSVLFGIALASVGASSSFAALLAPAAAPVDDAAATCAHHLEAIGRALAAYQKEKGALPAHLSDLYPHYLADKALFHCPADPSAGEPATGPADPKLPISYLYEMNLEKGPSGLLLGPGPSGQSVTWRAQKLAQREFFGDRVPVVRCWHHVGQADLLAGQEPFVLNLTLNGQVYRSQQYWETDPGTVPAVLSAMERDVATGSEAFRRRWSAELVEAYFNTVQPPPTLRDRLHALAGKLADLAKADAGKEGGWQRVVESLNRAAGDTAVPAATGGVPAQAVAKVMPGQEFAYSGTAEWKQSIPGGREMTMAGPVRLTATVTEAEPGKGYEVILLRRFEPPRRLGQPSFPGDAEVTTVRFRADLTPTASASSPSSPIGALLQILSVPLAPRAGLKEGQQWRQSEALTSMPRPVELVYTVTPVRVGDRDCLQVEKKLAQPLPFKPQMGEGSPELSDFGQTLCVDPESGLVLNEQIHQRMSFTAEGRQIPVELSAAISLEQTRQLPAAELASRVRQATALERVQRAVFSFQPGANRRTTLARAAKQIAAIRKEFPDSPYAPALGHLDEMLGQMRGEAEREARLQGLQGKPAPAFALKSLAGQERTLGAYRGKIILLNFFASW